MADVFPPINTIKRWCKVCVVWPYDGSFNLTSFNIYYRFLIFVFNIIALYAYYNIFRSYENISLVFINRLINMSVYFLQQVTNLIMCFINKQKMSNIIRQFILLDQMLSEIGSQPNTKDNCLFQSCVIATVFVFHIPIAYCHWVLYGGLTYKLCLFITLGIQNVFIIVMLVGLAQIITYRYRTINVQLCRLLQDLSTTTSSVILQRLRQLINIHTNLSDIVEKINVMFSLQILIYLVYTVTGVSLGFLLILRKVQGKKSVDVVDMLWMCINLKVLILIVLLVEQCHAAALEGNKTVLLVHRLHQPNTHISILDEIEHFSFSMITNYIKFSAGGILDIDRGFLVKIFVHVTTYLVISLQVNDVKLSENTTSLLQTELYINTTSLLTSFN